MLDVERKLGEPLEVALWRWRFEERKTLWEIGQVLHLSETGVFLWLRALGLSGKVTGPKPPRPESV